MSLLYLFSIFLFFKPNILMETTSDWLD